MAATVSIKEVNGASSGTPTTVTSIRLCTADSYNPGTNSKLVRPTSGLNRSFWKSLYLNADTTPPNEINNVRVYTDGTIGWTGVTLKFGKKNSYTQATGTNDVTGDDAATALSITMTNAATYTSASPLTLSGNIVNPNTGKITTDYLIIQAEIDNTAQPGLLSSETITFQYDEY